MEKPCCSTSLQPSCSNSSDTLNSSSIVLNDSPVSNDEWNYWNKRLGLLTADQDMLKRGEWLTDKHINAASVLIKEEFPKQLGLQDTLLLQRFDQYESEDSQFVQIVHVNGNHWLCVSNKFCPAGTVDIYDCSPGTGFSPSLKRQFNQSAMRAHFDLCVDKEKKDMFPVSTRCRRKKHEE